jgi:hypothetical protein
MYQTITYCTLPYATVADRDLSIITYSRVIFMIELCDWSFHDRKMVEYCCLIQI